MDLILTGRGVGGEEARTMGLARRLVEPGTARAEAVALAHHIAAFPRLCARNDRRSAMAQWDLDMGEALSFETAVGLQAITSGETEEGAARLAAGEGRGGAGV